MHSYTQSVSIHETAFLALSEPIVPFQMKEYIYYMVENFNIGPDATQVGLATYSTNARAQFYLNQYPNKRDLQNAISALSYEYGNTNTAAGLKLIRSGMFSERRGNRPDVPDYGR